MPTADEINRARALLDACRADCGADCFDEDGFSRVDLLADNFTYLSLDDCRALLAAME